jgi:nucleotide-binding universal stress UspA family protein
VIETIVVGVDGSDGGAAALDFAAAEAALRKTGLRIVSAWEVPAAVYGGGFTPPMDAGTLEAFGARAQQVADDAAAAVKEQHPSLEVEAVAAAGQPADVLLDRSADAELVVVGRRGLGGFKTLLLGSVSQQVVHHAGCPVVVVNQPATNS